MTNLNLFGFEIFPKQNKMGPREQPVIEKTEQELEAFLFNDLSQPNHSLSIENLYSVENGDNSNNGNGNNDDLQALPDDQVILLLPSNFNQYIYI